MLEVHNLSFKVGTTFLLQNISFTVGAGEVLAIVGPNGAGKSTLLKLLAGEAKPFFGDIYLLGNKLSSFSLIEKARCRAVMTQNIGISFPFTSREVVMMGRTPHNNGNETKKDSEIVDYAMSATNSLDFATKNYTTLSGGEKQRTILAKTAAQIWPMGKQPSLMLLDEPTSSLDIHQQHQILRFVRNFASFGIAIVIILHDLNLAAQYSDTVLLLSKGQIIDKGDPSSILTSQAIYKAFSLEAEVLSHPSLKHPIVVPKVNLA